MTSEPAHLTRASFSQTRPPAVVGSTARPRARPEVLAVPLHDELILHDERSGQTYVLNSTGAQTWKLCDGARSTATIVRIIASLYRVREENARDDVRELIDGLEDADLLDYR